MASVLSIHPQLVELATVGAENFKDIFFLCYDSQRSLMPQFYRAGSTVVWNGNFCADISALPQFFSSLPPTKHEITAVDAQPILPFEGDASTSSIMLTISGSVRYGVQDPLTFQETIVLEREGPALEAPYFILSDIRRDGGPVARQ